MKSIDGQAAIRQIDRVWRYGHASHTLCLEALAGCGVAKQSVDFKILCGGETLSRELADQLLEGGASLWNLYGPTETTIWSTIAKVEPGESPVLIGRPIANTQIYILDSHLQPVPVGVHGRTVYRR